MLGERSSIRTPSFFQKPSFSHMQPHKSSPVRNPKGLLGTPNPMQPHRYTCPTTHQQPRGPSCVSRRRAAGLRGVRQRGAADPTRALLLGRRSPRQQRVSTGRHHAVPVRGLLQGANATRCGVQRPVPLTRRILLARGVLFLVLALHFGFFAWPSSHSTATTSRVPLSDHMRLATRTHPIRNLKCIHPKLLCGCESGGRVEGLHPGVPRPLLLLTAPYPSLDPFYPLDDNVPGVVDSARFNPGVSAPLPLTIGGRLSRAQVCSWITSARFWVQVVVY